MSTKSNFHFSASITDYDYSGREEKVERGSASPNGEMHLVLMQSNKGRQFKAVEIFCSVHEEENELWTSVYLYTPAGRLVRSTTTRSKR